MARKSKLTEQQWQEIAQLRVNGTTYQQISDQYNITRKAVIDHFKINNPLTVVNQATQVLDDYQSQPHYMNNQTNHEYNCDHGNNIDDASNYSLDNIKDMNEFLKQNLTNSNKLVELHGVSIENCQRILKFISAVLSSDSIAVDQLERFIAFHSKVVKQLESLSKIYGMGVAPISQINQQFNLGQSDKMANDTHNHNNQSKRSAYKKFPDDEFTGQEKVHLIFCTSNEQAEIINQKLCKKCRQEQMELPSTLQ
jgi:hypothetical protein